METSKNAIEKNKLSLLYILEAFNQRMSDSQLLSVCLELGLMDYIDMNSCLCELNDAGLTERSESINGLFYTITSIGSSTYDFFKKQIPFSEREAIKAYADAHRDEMLMQSRIYSECVRIDEYQYRVVLKLLDNNLPVFEINLIAQNREEAERFRLEWSGRAFKIYENTIKSLLGA